MASRLAILVVLGLLVVVPVVRADGDPASDFLLADKVFLPYDTKIPKADQERLKGIVQSATKSGFPIKVAVIATDYDLGSVTVLWRQPQRYAHFLGVELSFVHKGPLLTVMPNGMGFYWGKRNPASQNALLAKIPIPAGRSGLAQAAITGVKRLAASYGVHVAAPTAATVTPVSHRNRNDRIVIGAAVGAAVFLGVLVRVLLRRRRAA